MTDQELFTKLGKLGGYSEKRLLLLTISLLIMPQELRQKFLFDSIE